MVSEAPATAATVNKVIAAQARRAGLPLSPIAAALAAPSPCRHTDRGRRTERERQVGASTKTTSGGAASGATASGASLTPALVAAWARLDAATFVRAVQPAFFAPRLAATGLGVTYYERTRTNVVVAGSTAAAARFAARLDVFGYAARTGAAGLPATALLPVIYYQRGDRRLADALAGDLGLPASQVVAALRAPAALTVVLPR